MKNSKLEAIWDNVDYALSSCERTENLFARKCPKCQTVWIKVSDPEGEQLTNVEQCPGCAPGQRN